MLGAGMSLTGCSWLGFGNDDQEIDSLDNEFDSQDAEGGAATGTAVKDLQAQIKELTGKQTAAQKKIDNLEDTISSLEIDLKDLQDSKGEVEDKLKEMKAGGGAPEGDVENLKEKLADLQADIQTLKKRASARRAERSHRRMEGPASSGIDVRKTYDRAVRLYYSRKYEDALGALKSLSDADVPRDLADNVSFWTAQCYYKLEDFDRAAENFQTVLDKFPMSNKIHEVRYMLGLAYSAMGEKSRAIEVLENALDAKPPFAIKKRIKAAIRNIE